MEANELPAFPCPDRGDGWADYGMTLRDYFAAHASEFDVRSAIEDLGSATVTEQDAPLKVVFRACTTGAERNAVARMFYADAMLKARDA